MSTAQITAPAYTVGWGTEQGFTGPGRSGWAVMYPGTDSVAMIFGGTEQSRAAAEKWADTLNRKGQ